MKSLTCRKQLNYNDAYYKTASEEYKNNAIYVKNLFVLYLDEKDKYKQFSTPLMPDFSVGYGNNMNIEELIELSNIGHCYAIFKLLALAGF